MENEVQLQLTIKAVLLRQQANPLLLEELVPLIREQVGAGATGGVVAFCVGNFLASHPEYRATAPVELPPAEPGLDSIRPGMTADTRAGVRTAINRELQAVGVLPPAEQPEDAPFDLDAIRKTMSVEERKAASAAIARALRGDE